MVSCCCISEKCNGIDGLVYFPIEGICQGINISGRQRVSLLTGLVLVLKKVLEVVQRFLAGGFKFQCQQELVKYHVKKIRSQAVVAS